MVRILTKLSFVSRLNQWLHVNMTYREGSAASASAALLPLMPTQTPQIKLHMPTVMPAQNNAYPVNWLDPEKTSSGSERAFIFEEKIMAMMTP